MTINAKVRKAVTSKRDNEINRLVAALKNFLSCGYDSTYQKTESAIEQLIKLENMARKRK